MAMANIPSTYARTMANALCENLTPCSYARSKAFFLFSEEPETYFIPLTSNEEHVFVPRRTNFRARRFGKIREEKKEEKKKEKNIGKKKGRGVVVDQPGQLLGSKSFCLPDDDDDPPSISNLSRFMERKGSLIIIAHPRSHLKRFFERKRLQTFSKSSHWGPITSYKQFTEDAQRNTLQVVTQGSSMGLHGVIFRTVAISLGRHGRPINAKITKLTSSAEGKACPIKFDSPRQATATDGRKEAAPDFVGVAKITAPGAARHPGTQAQARQAGNVGSASI
ncbi:hypothetical protein V1478_009662 [Vespula squamosa]|uniref:Uncharacterized protein n=1 Tax=Vespula squamosa TaxID=30214 RepID=A0ABD2AQB6_VESSQ